MHRFNKKEKFQKPGVKYLTITQDLADQRIDNFLIGFFKKVPKSRIYRMLRKGEVRINRKRASPFYRLRAGDELRLPPVYMDEKAKTAPPSQETIDLLKNRILYEDEYLIIINKPSGMSVHAGSTVRLGIVEALRFLYPKLPQLELAHRLDSETSGCLILAKRKRILREIHSLLREGKVSKIYWALTAGHWRKNELRVDLPLDKEYRDGAKHVVRVKESGKHALTVFSPIETFAEETLVEVKLFTGRTHQIRVHAAHQKHPIAGDDRYGEAEYNKKINSYGLKRMFLHARSVDFTLPSLNQHIRVVAPLDKELENVLLRLKKHRISEMTNE